MIKHRLAFMLLIGMGLAACSKNPVILDATATPMPTVEIEPTPTVNPSAVIEAAILNFEVTQVGAVHEGDPVQVSWSAQGHLARLCYHSVNTTDQHCETVNIEGTKDIPVLQGIMNFDLTVYGQNSKTTDSGRQRVITPCTHAWVVHLREDLGLCPEAKMESDGTMQPFEHGWMIWTGESTYVLANREMEEHRYLAILPDPLEFVPDRSTAPAPYYTPDGPDFRDDPDTAPDGFYVPEGRFGLIWRDEVGNEYLNRWSLGWATQPEAPYKWTRQCWIMKRLPDLSPTGTTNCWFELPSGELATLIFDGDNYWWDYDPPR